MRRKGKWYCDECGKVCIYRDPDGEYCQEHWCKKRGYPWRGLKGTKRKRSTT